MPLEPRGLVAEVLADGGRLTVWGAAKVVHTNRRILAALLGLPEERCAWSSSTWAAASAAAASSTPRTSSSRSARCARQPVAWTEDREENLRALNHSREQVHDTALALRADGTLLALRDRF